MSGLAVVYVVFAIVLGSLFAYSLLLSRRQREVEAQLDDLKNALPKPGHPKQR